jgi:hypothetical protein
MEGARSRTAAQQNRRDRSRRGERCLSGPDVTGKMQRCPTAAEMIDNPVLPDVLVDRAARDVTGKTTIRRRARACSTRSRLGRLSRSSRISAA